MMTELLPTSAVVFQDKIVQPWKRIPGQCFDIRPCALLNKDNDIALSLFFKKGNE